MASGAAGSAIQGAVAALRRRILETAAPGDFLGSEAGLQQELGLSRPTLRQAARILESEGLLVAKRGKNGGLFARLPTFDAVARVASVVLHSQGATLDDLADVNALIAAESARRAALNASDDEVQELRTFLDQRMATTDDSPSDVLNTILAVNTMVSTMSGSHTLRLFASVLSELAHADFGVNLLSDPQRRQAMRVYADRLVASIADRDPEEAARIVADHHHEQSSWLAPGPVPTL